MHIGYLTIAVRDMLRDYFVSDFFPDDPFTELEIEVMPDGKPPPDCGKKFLAVYGADWSPAITDNNIALDAYLGVNVTLTYRSPQIPPRGQGSHVYAQVQKGMAAICYHIMKYIPMQSADITTVPLYNYLAAQEDYVLSFTEYLRWMGTDAAPVPVFEDWFSAKNEHLMDPLGLDVMGYTMTVRFGQARAQFIMA